MKNFFKIPVDFVILICYTNNWIGDGKIRDCGEVSMGLGSE